MAARVAQKMGQQAQEIENIRKGIEVLGKSEDGAEILAPVSNGIIVRTKMTSNDTLLVNVGANTVVEKSREETLDLLGKQKEIIGENLKQGELQLNMMADNLHKIEEELKKLVE